MATRFVPNAGDIVWLEFDPQAGHEQAGRRPALVLTPGAYNRKSGMMVCCPLTTRIKDYPFEIPIATTPPSVALADQVKNLDWVARNARPMARATPRELAEVRACLAALLELDT